MRKVPTYDWDWFISHAPFKKILTEYCDLSVKKEVEKFYICCGIYDAYNHYEIAANLKKFQDNIEEIKIKLLNTNVCKKNKEIFDYVNKLEGSKSELCSLIMDGCIANCEGRFAWNWVD